MTPDPAPHRDRRPPRTLLGMVRLAALCLCAASVVTTGATRGAAATEPGPLRSGEVRVVTLQNGAHLLLAPDSLASAVDVGVWIEVGVRYERPGTIGVSHLLEHLSAHGAAPGGAEEYRRRIESEGGTTAAFTTADFTCFTQTVPRAALEQVFRMEAGRFSVKPTQAMLEADRAAVLAENRARARANPLELGLQRLYETALPRHPYRWPVLGSEADLRRITPGDCAATLRARYTPDHLWITVVGDFDPDEVLSLARRTFEPLTGHGSRDPGPRAEAVPDGERRAVAQGMLPVPELVVGWRVPGDGAADAAALDLLSELLSRGSAGRLQQRLVAGKQSCLFAQSGRDARRDGTMFWAAAAVRPGGDTLAVERDLIGEIEKLASEPVSGEELDRARRHLELALLLGRETARDRAQALGVAQMTFGDWREADRLPERIRALTPVALQQAAARTLTAARRTVVWMTPASSTPSARGSRGGRGGTP